MSSRVRGVRGDDDAGLDILEQQLVGSNQIEGVRWHMNHLHVKTVEREVMMGRHVL